MIDRASLQASKFFCRKKCGSQQLLLSVSLVFADVSVASVACHEASSGKFSAAVAQRRSWRTLKQQLRRNFRGGVTEFKIRWR